MVLDFPKCGIQIFLLTQRKGNPCNCWNQAFHKTEVWNALGKGLIDLEDWTSKIVTAEGSKTNMSEVQEVYSTVHQLVVLYAVNYCSANHDLKCYITIIYDSIDYASVINGICGGG